MKPGSLMLGAITAVVAIAVQPPAYADSPRAKQHFAIPAQFLGQALRSFAIQGGVQILFSDGDVHDRSSSALSGRFRPENALHRLLAGSGLVGIQVSPGKFLVRRGLVAISERTEARDGRPSPRQAARPPEPAPLAEISVTARRVEESLQAVPLADTVVLPPAVQRTHIESLSDLQRIVPELAVTSAFRDNQSIVLRGLPNTAGGAAVQAYFAEVPDLGPPVGTGYSSSGGGGPGIFYDLQSVQVLKGPQGTLFGQNTIGGAILFTPASPAPDFTGYIQGQIGNYGDHELQGAVNLPMVENVLAVRAAISVARRRGFTHDAGLDIDLDQRHYDAERLSLLFAPASSIRNSLVLNRLTVDQEGSSFLLNYYDPARLGDYPLADYLAAQRRAGIRTIAAPAAPDGAALDPRTRKNHWTLVNTTTLDVVDGLRLKNIFGFQRLSYMQRLNIDGTPYPINEGANPDGAWNNLLQEVTDELQFQVSRKSYDLVAGFYYSKQAPFGLQQTYLVSYGMPGADNKPSVTTNDERARSVAAYAQTTIRLGSLDRSLERFRLTAGIRYTWDDRSADDTTFNSAGGCGATVAVLPDCRVTAQSRSRAPTWNLTLDYRPSSKLMLYLAHRRGYIAGGTNATSPVPGTQTYAPEFLTDFEAGIKAAGRMLRVPVQADFAVFRGIFRDVQISTGVPSPANDGALISVVRNSARARQAGLELEVQAHPWRLLSFNFGYSFLDMRWSSYAAAGLIVEDPTFAAAPRNKVFGSVAIDLPVTRRIGQISVMPTVSYQSRIFHSSQPNQLDPGLSEPGYAVANLSVDWDHPLGAYAEFALFVTNITNKTYRIGAYPAYVTAGYSSSVFGEPRMFGVRFRFNFGDRPE